ncbi:bacillithiol biosynthesis cysteine-adding enzyme BshC [Lentibacillus amyloliquefaciens]|uniref:Putative cysteine ligase BshC n=1 Tax=Lentibacillus amyloliquefaciens TaxID=1472767 RepID=A0A0U3W2G4_9BACI|nr:bacillithiol biosynthesis cysteine-adding enzyme BshC [Lentibacillus amyloliquefaciens]ALX47378.1 bacillithiol biosynthesis cysteine-adding enzyme BshC [Lentibacillus amyloliquefaciens]
MHITPIKLQNQNALIDDYRNQEPNILEHFDYDPYSEETYQTRMQQLKQKQIDRDRLREVVETMNKRWDAPQQTYYNIERLKEENSVVVIGGQQAGLLTGPMYTINKIISIIQLARRQEAKLQVPVIPVFWIAGEDHDFDEINHVYVQKENVMTKHILNQNVADKPSVSTVEIDKAAAVQWVDELFEQLTETEHTRNVYRTIRDCLDRSSTYVDFFAQVVYQLFDEEGIVLVDSGAEELREIEREHFAALIDKQQEISSGVYTTLQQLNQKGYTVSLDTEPEETHLFYHKGNDRILLMRDSDGNWTGKQNEVTLTTNEMVETAHFHPGLLSNNVVTRPVMQELLFPTLAFIGGPGEVGYWSALKPAFHAVNMDMPPVVPRLSLTLVDRHIEKSMREYGISCEKAINRGSAASKTKWLASQSKAPLHEVASEVRRAIGDVHEPLRDIARETRSDLGELADKNLYYLNEHIEYLENRILKTIEENHKKQLHEFDLVHQHMHPYNGLQERIWNPVFWINVYGTDFIKKLVQEPCSFEDDHHAVYL